MNIFQSMLRVIALVSLTIFLSLSLFLIIKLSLKFRNNKKKLTLILLEFILTINTGIIGAALTVGFRNNDIFTALFSSMTMCSLLMMLFLLDKFSNSISNLGKSKTNPRLKITLIIFIILILLPFNHWETSTFYEITEINIQPLTISLLLILSIYIEMKSINIIKYSIKKILDPGLKEIYGWIQKGILSSSWIILGLVVYLINYLIPFENYEIGLIFHDLGTIVGIVIATFSIVLLYIGIILPERVLRKMYSRYKPMWNKNASEEQNALEQEENFKKSLKKLHYLLFD